jgi:pimeloyl-ACP methyl ester carboxylesterase
LSAIRRRAIRLLGGVALVYAGVCAAMFFGQRSLIYFPVPDELPAGAQRIELAAGDATLQVWARPLPGKDALIYFGGNQERVGRNFTRFAALLPRHSLYLVNYRGYGGSTGAPTEAALFADALAVYDHVLARHADVAVAGRSLGTGVAVYVASQRAVGRLALVTPYDSIENVARGRYPFLPVSWLLLDKFDSGSRAAQVRAPTLVVLGEHDGVIARERSDALIAKFAAGQARVEVVRGAGHNDLDYDALLAAFLGS